VVYASGREGWAVLDLKDEHKDMTPLLETILHRVLPPIADPEQPFQMLVTMLDYDNYVGALRSAASLTGRSVMAIHGRREAQR